MFSSGLQVRKKVFLYFFHSRPAAVVPNSGYIAEKLNTESDSMNDALLKNIRLQDPVFAPRQKTGRESTIPSCIRRCGETGRIKAFRLQ